MNGVLDAAARGAAGLFRKPLKTSYERPAVVPVTWAKRCVLFVFIGTLAVTPMISDYYKLAIIIAISVGVIGAVATNLISGIGGQAQIGMAALMAVGAFTAAEGVRIWNLPFPICVVLAGMATGLLGMLVAVPAMRVRGIYLIIATLALHYIALFTLTDLQAAQVGDGGYLMPVVRLGELSQVQTWYYVIVLAAVLSIIAMRNLLRTRYGRAWQTLALDEVGASVLGVNIRFQKILVFTFTSVLLGVGGALFGYYVGVVNIEPFTFELSVSFIAMMVIGGIGSVPGSVLGAIFVVGLPYALTNLAHLLPPDVAAAFTARLYGVETMIYGAFVIVFLVWERRGLVYAWQRAARGVAAWPLSIPAPSSVDL